GRAVAAGRAPSARGHGAPRPLRHGQVHDQRAGPEVSLFAAGKDRAGVPELVYGRDTGNQEIGGQCPVSEVRDTSQHALIRTSETKGTSNSMNLVPLFDLKSLTNSRRVV